MPMNDEEQLEFDRMKTARDSLLITNARLNSKLADRTWVGLTEGEIEASKPPLSNDAVVWELAVEWAEAKLKEKNT